jgi:hypothetical protein
MARFFIFLGAFLFISLSQRAMAQALLDSSTASLGNDLVGPLPPAYPLRAIKSAPVISPQPKPKPPLRQFLALSAMTYAAAGLDMQTTYTRVQIDRTCPLCYSHPFREYDPFAKPFIHLPSPAYYAAGFAVATGVNFLGWKMSRSKRWRRVWFIPQSLSIGGNCWGISTFH